MKWDWRLVALAGIGAGLVVYYFFNITSKKAMNFVHGRERFGGVIKGIRHIPFNDCKRICGTYYDKCVQDNKDADPGWCEEQFLNACVAECYYTPYHRI
jgi:hypothetical protein